jgi:hypothetical protein
MPRSPKTKDIILISFGIICILVLFSFPPISQNPSYHGFADQREIFQIPNFYNVITNLPFVVIGFAGLLSFYKSTAKDNKLAHLTLFIGVIGIGFGSAWYHYNPNNTTLVWDRIPMTVTFMSYFSIIVGRYVSKKSGSIILVPLLIIGVFSVCYWYVTEQNSMGDLRLYALVQFYPMLSIPLILFLYPAPRTMRMKIISIIVVYAIAKIAEDLDSAIFNVHHIISGHALKHLFASIAVLLMLLTLRDEHGKKKLIPET